MPNDNNYISISTDIQDGRVVRGQFTSKSGNLLIWESKYISKGSYRVIVKRLGNEVKSGNGGIRTHKAFTLGCFQNSFRHQFDLHFQKIRSI